MVFLFSSSLSPNSTYLNLPFTLDVPLSPSGSQDNHMQITILRCAILKIAKIFQSTAFLSNYTNNFIILKCPVCKKNPMWLPVEMFYITKCLWCTVCYREYYVSLKLPQEAVGCLPVIAIAQHSVSFVLKIPDPIFCNTISHIVDLCAGVEGKKFKAN